MRIDKLKIKDAMAQKGIKTQTQLANIMNVTKNQLSVMLSEKYAPLKSNVSHLCSVLGIAPIDIISLCEENTNVVESALKYKIDNHSNTRHYGCRAIELFAGAGGIALGLEKAGIETLAFVEIDKYCCDTMKKNRPHWNVINEDIKNIDFKPYKDKIDIVTGGFPCQSFSYAGKKMGFEDTRGTLFYEFARCIKESNPLVFMAENVRGLMSHDGGKTLSTIISIFQDLGYKVEYKLLKAVDYGVPQKRERIVIIGTRENISFNFPEKLQKKFVLKDALKDVPPSEGQQYSENKKKILSLIPPGGYWRDLPLDLQKSYMGKSFYSGGGRTGMARRISWDEPCLTLTCSPSQKQTERCHPEETRPFTVREYARIQTFPDDWDFSGGLGEKYKQIGNAVPVELSYHLGSKLYEAIIKYKTSK